MFKRRWAWVGAIDDRVGILGPLDAFVCETHLTKSSLVAVTPIVQAPDNIKYHHNYKLEHTDSMIQRALHVWGDDKQDSGGVNGQSVCLIHFCMSLLPSDQAVSSCNSSIAALCIMNAIIFLPPPTLLSATKLTLTSVRICKVMIVNFCSYCVKCLWMCLLEQIEKLQSYR